MIFVQTWATHGSRIAQNVPMSRAEIQHRFGRLVKDELAVLFRVARRMGCTPEEAEDTVQTTLLKAYRAWDSFDGKHLRSWLIRILRNERLMILRTERDLLSLDDTDAVEVADAPVWSGISQRLDAGQVLSALEGLPEIYRLVIQLCDVEDMTYEEVADALAIPVGTVRSRLFRGRSLLRDALLSAGFDPNTEVSR